MTYRAAVLTLLGALLVTLSGAPAAAQPSLRRTPYLVRDLNTSRHQIPTGLFAIVGFVKIDGALFFSMDDGIHGPELWTVDRQGQVALVRDICPGVCGSILLGGLVGTALGQRLLFVADDGVHGHELWISDGTAAGTLMVADIAPGAGDSAPYYFTAAGDTVFFAADDGIGGRELWVSDGTSEGTARLTAVDEYPEPEPFLGDDGHAWFFARGAVSRRALWRSDGTAAGTRIVKDPEPGKYGFSTVVQTHPCFPPGYTLLPDGDLLFGSFGETDGLWRSDGTSAGTQRLVPLRGVNSFAELGNEVLFWAQREDYPYQPGLWRTDGTAAGTSEISSVAPWYLKSDGTRAYFVADDGTHGFELWTTDGTGAGTVLVDDLLPGPLGAFGEFDDFLWLPPTVRSFFNGTFVFSASDGVHGFELWGTDGPGGASYLVGDVNPGAASSQTNRATAPGSWLTGCSATTADGIYTFAYDEDRGLGLWRTAATPESTELVRDMTDQTSTFFFINDFFVNGAPGTLGERLLFFAADGEEPWALSLWVSDGSGAGTRLLTTPQQIVPFRHSREELLVKVGDTAFLAAETDEHGVELWASDGTAEGTRLVKDLNPGDAESIPQKLTALGDRLLFFAHDGVASRLWTTDGSAAGTTTIADLAPCSNHAPFEARDTVVHDGVAYLCSGGLWRSDGTVAGTWRLLEGGAPTNFESTPFGLFFSRTDAASGRELWVSDGTAAGTRRVRDLQRGSGDGFGVEVQPTHLSGLLFFAADDGVHGTELWVSDGSEDGTRLVSDLFPGGEGSSPHQLRVAGSRLYFVATDPEHGRELWVSDGSAAGTRLVSDLNPGPESSLPSDLVGAPWGLVLAAYQPATGRELWVVRDGHSPRVTELVPGPGSSSPTELRLADRHLFFIATDHRHGFELWAWELGLPVSPMIFTDGFESGDLTAWGVPALP